MGFGDPKDSQAETLEPNQQDAVCGFTQKYLEQVLLILILKFSLLILKTRSTAKQRERLLTAERKSNAPKLKKGEFLVTVGENTVKITKKGVLIDGVLNPTPHPTQNFVVSGHGEGGLEVVKDRMEILRMLAAGQDITCLRAVGPGIAPNLPMRASMKRKKKVDKTPKVSAWAKQKPK